MEYWIKLLLLHRQELLPSLKMNSIQFNQKSSKFQGDYFNQIYTSYSFYEERAFESIALLL